MGDIYRSARKVTAWLGSVTLKQEGILQDMFDQSKHFRRMDPASERYRNIQKEILSSVLRSEYCSRMWIVPEMVLARSLTTQQGHFKIDIDASEECYADTATKEAGDEHRYRVVLVMLRDGVAPGQTVWSLHLFGVITWLRKTCWSKDASKLTISRALMSCAHQLCADPHDKVFAAVGMTNNTVIPIDYRMSLSLLNLRILLFNYFEDAGTMGSLDLGLSLATAFGWSILHPTVALLLQEATWSLRVFVEVQTTLASGDTRAQTRHLGKTLSTHVLSQAVNVVSLRRYNILRLRLKICEHRNARMEMPGNTGEAHTYREWVRIIRDVHIDMQKKTQGSRHVAGQHRDAAVEQENGEGTEIQ